MFANSKSAFQGLALALVVGVASQRVEAEVVEGKLVADQRGQISAQMTGERSQRVESVLVRVGDRVKKGDVLARLNTVSLEADRLIAQRALEESRASVEVAKSVVARARLDYDRRASLKGSPSYNRAGFEDAEVELRASQSRLQNAESNANRREAEVARCELEIRLAEIKAPYDGVVLEIMTNVGASVTQRAPNLLTLLDLTQVEIAFRVPQGRGPPLALGQSVGYTLADGKRRVAKVRALLPPASPQETAPTARLQLDSAELPPAIQHNQSVKVYVGE